MVFIVRLNNLSKYSDTINHILNATHVDGNQMKCHCKEQKSKYSDSNEYYKKNVKNPTINNRTKDLDNCDDEYVMKAPVTSKHVSDYNTYKHSKTNVYTCDLCDYAETQKGVLSSHMKSFHSKIKAFIELF